MFIDQEFYAMDNRQFAATRFIASNFCVKVGTMLCLELVVVLSAFLAYASLHKVTSLKPAAEIFSGLIVAVQMGMLLKTALGMLTDDITDEGLRAYIWFFVGSVLIVFVSAVVVLPRGPIQNTGAIILVGLAGVLAWGVCATAKELYEQALTKKGV
jgi:peptidoglycan/LPS O-acetylase OafA/YrhL